MHKNIEIRGFDVQEHEAYAVKDSDTDEILGLIFQDPRSPFQTVVVVQKSIEMATIDVLQGAQAIVEAKKDNAAPR